MRAVVQRVLECSVTVERRIIATMESGLLIYLGVSRDDTEKDIAYIARKILGLRIFEDADGKMNLSVRDIEGKQITVISQFTLYGDVRKGKRPSFEKAAPPEKGKRLYKLFINTLKEEGFLAKEGSFGDHMDVSYVNNGPVTILVDSTKLF